jgi:hypothetical protein
LGLLKAAFFVAVVRWCLKNDTALDDENGSSGDGGIGNPATPYSPPDGGPARRKWKVLQRSKQDVK